MTSKPIIYTKPILIEKLKEISAIGWISNARHGNHGGIGNTLEDLLGIKENNLPIPNAAEWELKTQRLNTSSLTTLFHIEPSPRAIRFVPQILLPKYGWPHKEAGKKYPKGEMAFHQTIQGKSPTDRGFGVVVDRKEQKVLISFNSSAVDSRHAEWLKIVKKNVGLGELSPQPYWGFDDLEHKAGTKLLNTFYVQAEVKKEKKKEFYRYSKVMMLEKFNFEGFLKAIEEGKVLPDFDARTGHNHGTKFRLRQNCLPMLYKKNNRSYIKNKNMETQEKRDKAFPITSVCRADLESAGFDTTNIDDDTMIELASKMANAYCDMGFWESLEVLADNLGVKKVKLQNRNHAKLFFNSRK